MNSRLLGIRIFSVFEAEFQNIEIRFDLNGLGFRVFEVKLRGVCVHVQHVKGRERGGERGGEGGERVCVLVRRDRSGGSCVSFKLWVIVAPWVVAMLICKKKTIL